MSGYELFYRSQGIHEKAGAAAVTMMTKIVDGMGTNKSKEEKYMIPKKSQTIKLKDANSTNIPVYIKSINLN